MSEERKLFSQADEFDFKRKFVIAYMASEFVPRNVEVIQPHVVQNALDMADKWWEAIVEHGVNDTLLNLEGPA
jgi:hypothetical protein